MITLTDISVETIPNNSYTSQIFRFKNLIIQSCIVEHFFNTVDYAFLIKTAVVLLTNCQLFVYIFSPVILLSRLTNCLGFILSSVLNDDQTDADSYTVQNKNSITQQQNDIFLVVVLTLYQFKHALLSFYLFQCFAPLTDIIFDVAPCHHFT